MQQVLLVALILVSFFSLHSHLFREVAIPRDSETNTDWFTLVPVPCCLVSDWLRHGLPQ